jgi:hypothetical protein
MTEKDKRDIADLLNNFNNYSKNDSKSSITPKAVFDWVVKIGILIITAIIVPMKAELSDLSEKMTKQETREEYKSELDNRFQEFMTRDFYTTEDHKKNMIPYENKISRNTEEVEELYKETNKIYNEIFEIKKEQAKIKEEILMIKN